MFLSIYLFRLDCNDECKTLERNRRIDLAFKNTEPSTKVQTKYSDFIKSFAKKDANLVKMIHDKLTDLVRQAKDSKQRSRSHSFPTMNREKRQVSNNYYPLNFLRFNFNV